MWILQICWSRKDGDDNNNNEQRTATATGEVRVVAVSKAFCGWEESWNRYEGAIFGYYSKYRCKQIPY